MKSILLPLVSLTKGISAVSKRFNLGSGSTWPGHIALSLAPTVINEIVTSSSTKVIFIVGTNGKTTTATMLTTILREDGKKIIQNASGANLLNGIASTLLLNTSTKGKLKADYAVFEVDENTLPLVLQHVTPKAIVALNLFRDQLDRYGELDSIARKWNMAFRHLGKETVLILNADDPLIAYLAKDVNTTVTYFGLPQQDATQKKLEHAADSIYCPNCGHKLFYSSIFFSHLGIWECPSCGVKRPLPMLSEVLSPLPGTYNAYNTLAASLVAKSLDISDKTIEKALQKVTPAFGRQEVLDVSGTKIQLFLSKNPVSMNESLQTVVDLGAKNVLFVLNDRIPDGRDVSWIWDIDVEKFAKKLIHTTVSGDRTYDMALRLHYGGYKKVTVEPSLKLAIAKAIDQTPSGETLYILPTYSAMLDLRKILTGRKIL